MHTMCTTPLRYPSTHMFYDFVDRVVHRVNAPRGPLNQCEYWRELGWSSQKMNEPSDDSEVVNNSLEAPDQVPAKK